jgi:hypothetical protein
MTQKGLNIAFLHSLFNNLKYILYFYKKRYNNVKEGNFIIRSIINKEGYIILLQIKYNDTYEM